MPKARDALTKRLSMIGGVSALIAGSLGLVVLWAWAAGVGDAFGLDHRGTAMAPSTALLMGLSGMAIFLQYRWPGRVAAVRIGLLVAVLLGSVGGMVALRSWFGWFPPIDQWMAQANRTVVDFPLGLMSPVTAVSFVIASVVLLLHLIFRQHVMARRAATVLAAGLLLTSVIIMGNFSAGQPWSFGNRILPMALWTDVSFLFLSSALLLDFTAADSSAALLARRLGGMPLTLAAIAAAMAGMVGAMYLRHEKAQMGEEAHQYLKAIGETRANQIGNWREERANDARFFANASFVTRQVQSFFRGSSGDTRGEVLRWLKLIKAGDRYTLTALFDTNALLRVAVPKVTNSPPPLSLRLMADAFEADRAIFSDLQRGGSGETYLDVAVPLLAPVSPSGKSPAEVARTRSEDSLPELKYERLGILLMRSDLRRFLYPLLQSWPGPSPTAETILCSRDGEDVVILNELRHRSPTAANLRIPIHGTSDTPVVQAALGRVGATEGRDYRGVRVLADIRPVPNSPWWIVTKIDRTEIDASLTEHAWFIVAMTVLLSGVVGVMARLLWERQQMAFERERLALADRVKLLMQSANDAIIQADEQNRIIEANERASELYGYSLAELRGLPLEKLRAPEARATFTEDERALKSAGRLVVETLHQRKDGSLFPVEVSSRITQVNGGQYKLGILRDISERKTHEAEIARLTRLYATLSEINQSIVRVSSRQQLFQKVCKAAVGLGGFKLAWIAWSESETKRARPIAYAGEASEYLESTRVTADDSAEAEGPVGLCLREGKVGVFNDLSTDERALRWRNAAVAHGLRAMAVFPIRFKGEVCGGLSVYADEAGVFQDREIALLEETATDISFALDHLAQQEERRKAELALLASKTKLEAALASMTDAVFITDHDGRIVDFNEAFATFHKFKCKAECPQTLAEFPTFLEAFVDGKLVTVDKWAVNRALQGESAVNVEYTMRRKDSGETWVGSYSFAPIRNSHGVVVGAVVAGRDVTELKQAEEALRHRLDLQNQLTKIATTVPGLIYSFMLRTDGTMCIPYTSKAIDGIFGLTSEGVRENATAALSIIHPDDIVRVKESIRRSAQEMKSWRAEFRIRNAVRGDVWVEGHSVPQREAGGEILWHGYLQDVTDRKCAEASLRESQERLTLALSASRMGVWEWDVRANAIFWSPESFALMDMPETDAPLTLESFTSLVHPEDRQRVMAALEEAVAEKGSFMAEFRVVRPDGRVITVANVARCTHDEAGKPLRLLGTVQDVTDRKQAEEKLRTLSRAVEQSAASVVITNPAGDIEYVNPKFTEVTGYTLKEIRGKNPRILRAGETSADEYKTLWQTITRGVTWQGEFHNRKKNGELFWESASISPVMDETGRITHFLALKEDITEKKRLGEQLRQAQKMEAIGQLAGGVAHDFNNILAATMMQLGLLQQRTDLHPEVRDALTDLNAHAERAASLTRQLLLFGRRSVMQTRTLDLNEVVENLLKMLRRLVGEHIKMEWCGETQLPTVVGDAGMLEQVVMNLVVNARDAMPKGGQLSLRTETVEVTAAETLDNPDAREGKFVCLNVADTGCGMDEMTMKKIFEPFFTTKPAGKGTGLGLATIYGIVSQHGGWITTDTELNVGSTFKVFLPVTAKAQDPPLVKSQPQPVRGNNETVLLVEDDPAVRITIGSFLTRWGYQVLTAANGVEATQLWEANAERVDLLFTDMVMPEGMTGLELAQRLRATRPDLKVIISSGYSSELLQQGNMAAEKLTYVPKPCPAMELSAIIRRCLGKE